jgi:aspartyl-tRNA(Asn)/glutamyl-tRNA(Gln) amidotransferase subunit A
MSTHSAPGRIRDLDGALHAFVEVFDPPLGSGEGPTVAIKDLIDIAGYPTGGGARTPVIARAEQHAVVIDRLLAAGYRIVGKTHTVELAYGGWGTNRAVGTPRNPWAPEPHHAPGGSSSGSAVAVAAGLCDVALGTDTGGSVRIPAALCGVVGLKPGRGLVSRQGVLPLSPSLDTVGALARDVATAARALAVISAGAEDTSRPAFDAQRALTADVRGWPVAAIPVEQLVGLDPEVSHAYRTVLQRLSTAGVDVRLVAPEPPWDSAFGPTTVLMAGEGWRCWRDRIERHEAEMDLWIVRRLRVGATVSDEALAAALAARIHDQAAADLWLSDYAALLTPTCPSVAPPLDAVDESQSPLSRYTRGANYLDLPAASIPCGLSSSGLRSACRSSGGVKTSMRLSRSPPRLRRSAAGTAASRRWS